MKHKFVSDEINWIWVCGGALIVFVTVSALAMRQGPGGGVLPSVIISVAIVLLGVAGHGAKRLTGGLRWGSAVFVAGSLWALVHGLAQDAIYSVSASAVTSTSVVTFIDLAFVLLFAEAVRRGGVLDSRLWRIGATFGVAVLLAQLIPIVVGVATSDTAAASLAVGVVSPVVPIGTAALGALLIFAGAAQRFGVQGEVKA